MYNTYMGESNSIVEGNKKVFSRDLDVYKSKYLRLDEVYVMDRYFKGKVLVLGCGAGRTLLPIKARGFDVTGVDINPDMVREAKKTGVQVYEMDACNLDFPDESFDTVFFPFHGIDFVHPDIYRVVSEAKSVLKANGVFVFNSHNRFFVKKLHRFFDGDYSNYAGLVTYRTTPLDWFRLKKYFRKVRTIQRISIAVSWKNANWKDLVYKLFPFFNKSTYFICE